MANMSSISRCKMPSIRTQQETGLDKRGKIGKLRAYIRNKRATTLKNAILLIKKHSTPLKSSQFQSHHQRRCLQVRPERREAGRPSSSPNTYANFSKDVLSQQLAIKLDSGYLHKKNRSGRIAHVGIVSASCRLPGGASDINELWDLLKSGKSTSSRIPVDRIETRDILIDGKKYSNSVEGGNFISQDVTLFDSSFFDISNGEAKSIDPQQRILLECVQECFENAGILQTKDIGVFIGLMEKEYVDLMGKNRTILSFLGSMCAVIAGRVNYVFGCHGPAVTVDTACSSFIVAVELAMNALKNGRCSQAIVAGVNLILSEQGQGARANGKMLSRNGMSLSFDARASGYGRSDGCTVILLEEVKYKSNYLGIIRGINVNHGGKAISLTTPNSTSQHVLLRSLLYDNGFLDTQYWEAHGTGTAVGDPVETEALSQVLGEVMFGSIKSSIGHGEASAGGAALIKLALMLQKDYIPPLIHFHVLNKKINAKNLTACVIGESLQLKTCGLTSFGVSGTNAAAIVSAPSNLTTIMCNTKKNSLFLISAKEKSSLMKMMKNAKDVTSTSENSVEQIAKSFALRKRHFKYRCALILDAQGKELFRCVGHKVAMAEEVKFVVSILNCKLSYDLLHIPSMLKHFLSLHNIMSNKDKLLISFINFMVKLLEKVEFYTETTRELVAVLLARSLLPISKDSVGLLNAPDKNNVIHALKKFDTLSEKAQISNYIKKIVQDCTTTSAPCIKIICNDSTEINRFKILSICAQLYTNRIQFNFSQLFEEDLQCARIPTYPFNRKRLWFNEKNRMFDHYLLGTVEEKTSHSTVFKNYLDDTRHPELFGKNRIDLGVALEIAHTALLEHVRGGIVIKDIYVKVQKIEGPTQLLTLIETTRTGYEVHVKLNKRRFFVCKASSLQLNESRTWPRIPTKVVGSSVHYSMHVSSLKTMRVTISHSLREADIAAKHNQSCLKVLKSFIELAERMLPGILLNNFKLFSNLPVKFKIVVTKDKGSKRAEMWKGSKLIMFAYEKDFLNTKTDCTYTKATSQYPRRNTLAKKNAASQCFATSNNSMLDIVLSSTPTLTSILKKVSETITPLHEMVNQKYGKTQEHSIHSDLVKAAKITSRLKNAFSDAHFTTTDLLGRKTHAAISRFIGSLHIQKKNFYIESFAFSALLAKKKDKTDLKSKKSAVTSMGRRRSDKCVRQYEEETQNVPKDPRINDLTIMPLNSRNPTVLSQRSRRKRTGAIADDIVNKLIEVTQETVPYRFEINNETLSTGFIELGLDSLSLVDFVDRLNRKFFPTLHITTTDVFDHPTISKLAEHIRELLNNQNRSQHVRHSAAAGISNNLLESIEGERLSGHAPQTIYSLAPTPTNSRNPTVLSQRSRRKRTGAIADDIVNKLIEVTQETVPYRFEINNETLSTGFIELGLDSLSLVDFVDRLNRKCFPTLHITTTDVFDHPTLSKLAEHIRELLNNQNRSQHVRHRTAAGISNNLLESIEGGRLSGHAPQTINSLAPTPTNSRNPTVLSQRSRRKRTGAIADEIVNKLIEVTQETVPYRFEINNETLSTGFIELGLDSLSLVDFVDRLNRKCFPTLHITTTDVFDHPTLSKLAEHIRELLNNQNRSQHVRHRTAAGISNNLLESVEGGRLSGHAPQTINSLAPTPTNSRNPTVLSQRSRRKRTGAIADEIVNKLIEVTQETVPYRFEINNETLSTGFIELGLDSLSLVDFVDRINRKCFPTLHITTTDVFDHPTISKLAEHIRELLNNQNRSQHVRHSAAAAISNNLLESIEGGRLSGHAPQTINSLAPTPTNSRNPTVLSQRSRRKRTGAIADDIVNKLIEVTQETVPYRFEINNETLSTGFIELGLDSLSLVDFVDRLNRKCFPTLHITTTDVFDHPTLSKLAEHIRELLNNQNRSQHVRHRTAAGISNNLLESIEGGRLSGHAPQTINSLAPTPTNSRNPTVLSQRSRRKRTGAIADEIVNKLIEVTQETVPYRFEINNETLSTGFIELGLDSLSLVDFVDRINRKCFPTLHITTTDVFDHPTISKLAEHIRELLNNQNRSQHVRHSAAAAISNNLLESMEGGRLSGHAPQTIYSLAPTPTNSRNPTVLSQRSRRKRTGAIPDDIVNNLIEVTQETVPYRFEINNETLSTGFIELGLDSLSLVDFVDRLNRKCFPTLHITTTDVFDHPTLSKLAEHIRELLNNQNRSQHVRHRTAAGISNNLLESIEGGRLSGHAPQTINSLAPTPTNSRNPTVLSQRSRRKRTGAIADEIVNKLIEVTQETVPYRFEINNENLSTGFIELGLDSLSLVDFVDRINRKCFPTLHITTTDVFDHPTISKLAEHIRELLNNQNRSQHVRHSAAAAISNNLLESIEGGRLSGHAPQTINSLAPTPTNSRNPTVLSQRSRRKRTGAIADDIVNKLIEVTQETVPYRFEINNETLSTGFIELGLDSLSLVDFVDRLNRKYFPTLHITTTDVFDHPTLSKLAEHIRELLNNQNRSQHVRHRTAAGISNNLLESIEGGRLSGHAPQTINSLAPTPTNSRNPTVLSQRSRRKRTGAIADEIVNKLIEVTQETVPYRFEINNETLSTGFIELGLDSLSLVDFVDRLNRKCFPTLHITTTDVFDHPTLSKLAEHIRELLNNQNRSQHVRHRTAAEISNNLLESIEGGRLSGHAPQTINSLAPTPTNSRNLTVLSQRSRRKRTGAIADEIVNKLIEVTQETVPYRFEINNETLSTGFIELGLDSLSLVDFVDRLNRKCFPTLHITTTDVFDHPTLSKLAEHIRELLNNQNRSQHVRHRTAAEISNNLLESIEGGRLSGHAPQTINSLAPTPTNSRNLTVLSQRSRRKRTGAIADDIVNKLIEVTQETVPYRFEINNETLSTGFIELGLDSLSLVDFVDRINRKCFPTLHITTNDVFDHPTISKLAEHIRELLNNQNRSQHVRHSAAAAISNNLLESIEGGWLDIYTGRKIKYNTPAATCSNPVYVEEDRQEVEQQHLFAKNVHYISKSSKPQNKLSPVLRAKAVSSFDPLLFKQTSKYKNLIGYSVNCLDACEAHADFLLSMQPSYIKSILYLVNLRSQETLWLNINEHYDVLQISQFIPNSSIIQFNSSCRSPPTTLFRSLTNLSQLLIRAKIAVTFIVPDISTLSNALANSFFKTLAAEKFPLIQCVHNESLSVLQVPTHLHSSQVKRNWLITGGLSGIGFAIAKWLVNNCKVRNLILISRRYPSKGLLAEIKELKKTSNVVIISASVTDYKTMAKWFAELTFNIDGVIHGAGVLRDAVIERQNVETFEEVFSPKGEGFHVLQRLLMEYGHRLDHLIVMSSVTAVLGNAGQLNYGVANAYLDHQISILRNNGCVGTTIHWGNWLEIGMAAKSQKKLRALGFLGLTTNEALAFMAYVTKYKPVELMAAKINWKKLLEKRLDIGQSLASECVNINASANQSGSFSQTRLALDTQAMGSPCATYAVTYQSAQSKAPLQVCTCGLCHNGSYCDSKNILKQKKTSKNRLELTNGCRDERIPSEFNTRLLAALQNPSFVSTSVFDLFGLNVFSSDETDFKRTKSERTAYLRSTYSSPITFSNDKLHFLHATGPSPNKVTGKSVMIFCGESAQYTGMGTQLSNSFPVFKEQFEKCLQIADRHLRQSISLLNIVNNPAHVGLLHQTHYAQPVMFAYGFACAMLWKYAGFQPNFYLGQGVGEIVAGVVSGILSLENGIQLVVERGVVLEKLANRGAFLSLNSSAKADILAKFNATVTAINSSRYTEIAGEYAEQRTVTKFLTANNMRAAFTDAKYPLHSALIKKQELQPLRAALEAVHFKKAQTPVLSSITGGIISTFCPDYLIQQAISTVNILDCIRTLIFLNVTTWVEAGPSNVSGQFVRDTLHRKQMTRHAILQTASNGLRDVGCFLNTALELEKRAVPIRWTFLYQSNTSAYSEHELVEFPVHFRGASSEIDRHVLRNHRVCEENIIPGAYQFYILLSWLNIKCELGTYFKLVNTKLLTLWKYDEGFEYDLYQTNRNTVYLVINGITRCSSHIVFCKKRCVPCLDANELRKECTKKCNMKRFYDGMAVSGLDYRDQFQAIRCLKKSESRTYSLLDYKKPHAIWTLFDAAMHAVCVNVVDRRPDVYFLPIHIAEIYLCPSFDVDPSQSIVVVTDKIGENEKFIQAHACLYVNDQLLFQYKNKFSLVLRRDRSLASSVFSSKGDRVAVFSAAEAMTHLSANIVAPSEDTSVFILSYDGCFCSSALDTAEFWQQIKGGIEERACMVREFTSTGDIFMDIDIAGWDPEFFGITPTEAQHIDVTQRLMMQSVWRCLERVKTRTISKNTGVFIGLSSNDFENRVYSEIKEDAAGYYSSGTNGSCVAGRIAHWLKLEGPAIVVDTACSSSFTALISAVDALMSKRCDYALVGSINLILHDTVTEVLKNAGMLSAKEICQVFDAEADGYVRSEAFGCVLLSRFGTSSLFQISRWAMGHNGDSAALQVPNGRSQEKVMKQIYEERILDVECHGTGTSLGDPVEAQAVSKVYGHATVSSIKGQAGHAEAASGMASLMSSILQMKHNYRSYQSHFKCPNPRIDSQLLQVNSVGEYRILYKFAINNFGFSGTNCSILVEKLPRKQTFYTGPYKYHLAPISARDEETLLKSVNDLKDFVSTSDKDVGQICTSLQKIRTIFKCRYFILYNNKRQVMWEYGCSSSVSDSTSPTKNNDSVSFEYGRGFCLYRSHFNLNSIEFYNILSDQKTLQKTAILATGMQFHLLLGTKFVEGQSIQWSSYNVENVNPDIELPAYAFKQKPFWPFEKQFASNFGVTRGVRKNIYFEKVLVEIPREERDVKASVVNFGRKMCLDNIKHHSISAINNCDSISQNTVLLYHPYSSSTQEALKLINLWQILEMSRNFILLVACRNNGTSYTEWTALLRTLASERSLPYKFVSYSSLEQLKTELSTYDAFESIFYRGSRRCVERLSPAKPRKVGILTPKHLLITGGKGGIGRKIISIMSPQKTTIVTRSHNHLPASTCIKPQTDTATINTNVTSLKLPPEEYYDIVVHCAGVVDNAPMPEMDRNKFLAVCLPKVKGLQILHKQLVGRIPIRLIVASSVACILGSRGQANYAFANGLMTSLAQDSDIPTQIVHWGPWKNTGLLQNTQSEKINKQLQTSGWDLLEAVDALDVLSTNAKSVMVFSGDFKKIVNSQSHLRKFLSRITLAEDTPTERLDLSPLQQKRSNVLHDQLSLKNIIKDVSGIDNLENHSSTPLMKLGIDSLMIEDIRIKINKKLRLKLTSREIYDNCTLNSLSRLISGCEKSGAQPLDKDLIQPYSTEQSVEIAIIGSSGAFSGCDSIDDFWRNLLAGKECLRRTKPRHEGFVDAAGTISNIDKFDYKFWNVTQEDAAILDPQLRVFLQTAYHALEKSGYIRQRNCLRVGVFAGAEPNDYGEPHAEAEGSLRRLFAMNMKDFVSTFTAHMLNLRGPAVGVYSACSTALLAITQACNSLRLSNIDLAIAGGVSLVFPNQTQYMFQEGLVLSRTGTCRPFDKYGDGTVRGSAMGCVVLKRLDQALRDKDHIEAIIRSYGISNDGLHKASFMAPNCDGQYECMREALASLTMDEIKNIRYLECHGTGTRVGDEIEIDAIKRAYKDCPNLTIGSVKANIGHGFAGAGMAGLFKTMRILQSYTVPPQININDLRADIPYNVNMKRVALQPGSMAAVSAFGIGGTNVHLVVKRSAPLPVEQKGPQTFSILPISGVTSNACIVQCRAIAEYMSSHPEVDLEAVAATLQTRREHFEYRVAIVASSVSDAVSQLTKVTTPTRSITVDIANICFFFAPQGVQFPNMERDSLNQASVFTEELRRMTTVASGLFKTDFTDVMYPNDPHCDKIFQAKYAQVAVFIICKAILAQLQNWGIASNLLLGHSVGEYTAACYAGIIDEYSCMKLLKQRGELICKTQEARMLLVNKSNMHFPEDTEVSAILSENLRCVVGSPKSIQRLAKRLSEEQATYKELLTKYGFHTSMMNAIKEQFLELLDTVTFSQGQKKIVSNVDGRIITSLTKSYCWTHMRSPVNLKKCLDTVLSNKNVRVIVEIGPSGVLKHLLAENCAEVRVISTVLKRARGAKQRGHSQLFQSVADLWTCGFEVDFVKVLACSKFDPHLPQYPFEKMTCWRRKLDWSRGQYYTASWRPRSGIREERAHFHSENVLVISHDHGEFLDLGCKACNVRTIKPSKLLCSDFDFFANFSLIIYVPDGNLANLEEPMLISHKICSAIATLKTRFIVVSLSGEAAHWTTIGPIREYHLGRERKNVFVHNSGRLPLVNVIYFASKFDEEIVLATKNFFFSMIYAETELNDRQYQLGKTVVVIGGTGAVGSAYVNVLRKKAGIVNIVVLSRKPLFVGCVPAVTFFKVDICDKNSVEKILNELYSKYGSVDTIIHAAGKATSRSLNKSVPEMLDVLRPKVAGVMNVLEYLRLKNIQLENLVMASSLSSVLALQGTEDYAAANIFLDALALNGHPNVGRVLSVQWPAWRGRGIASTYGTGELQSMLMTTALLPQEGKRAVRETLGFSGVVAHSSIPPIKLRRELERAQLAKERVETSLKLNENQSLKEKVACIWSDVLDTHVGDDSDFFAMGGNSLSALRVVWSLNTMLKMSITVDMLFRNPMLKEFVKALPCAIATHEEFEAFDETSSAELTYQQENMFLLRQLERGTQYNILFAIYLRRTAAGFSKETLIRTIHTLVARQHSLRTCFYQESDYDTRQVVLSLTECFQNLSCENIRPQKHTELVEHERQHEFSLKEVPLRLRMNRINGDYVVLFNQHHILTDGWSITVLAKELKNAYSMYLRREEHRAKPISFSISQYAQWQRIHIKYLKEIEELKKLLAGCEATTLPQKTVKENIVSGKVRFRKLVQILPDSLVQRMKKLAKMHHTTEFVISLSAFVMSMRKLKTNNEDDSIVLGYPVLGRNEKVKDLIGYFLNNMVMALKVNVKNSLEEVIFAVKKVTSEMRKFENVPFHKLVANLNLTRQAREHPLFQVFFNYRHELDFPRVELADAHLKISQLSANKIFSLSVSFDETSKGTRIMIEYNSTRYRTETIRLLMNTLLQNFSEQKRPHLEETGNYMDYPLCALPKCYSFIRGMQNTSVIRPYSSVMLSYEEMHAKISNIAEILSDTYTKLLGSPARSDDIVAVEVNFRDAVEVFMALHQVGVGYAPIDTTWPVAKKAQIAESIPSLFVVDENLFNYASRLPGGNKRVKMNKICEEDVAYTIHTSGSTGKPKGVVLSHKSLSSFLCSATRQTLMRPKYRVSHSVNVIFDVSVLNIFGSTVNGCELSIHEDFRYSPFEVAKMRCNFIFLTSATFNALTIEDLQKMSSVEKLYVGGETINNRKLKAALELGLDVTQIYGPTESTVWSLTNRCKISPDEGALIGTPMPNESCFTKHGAYEAELILKGSKVARGYIGNVGEKKFYTDNGCPCYATGDLVRREKEGMFYRGRIDRQVKLRGHRVETEEVERAILRSFPEVLEVSVLPLNNYLIAFVVTHESLHENMLKTRLKTILPPFMTPSRFVRMNRVPLNSSGKVDKSLLLKEYHRTGNVLFQQVSSKINKTTFLEDRLISIVRKLLEVPEVKTNDSFFSLGGHSLLLFELKREILTAFAIEIEVHELFSDITIAEMAKSIANKMQASVLKTDTSVIIRLRETIQGKINVFLIHAVGGSIFPYHAFIYLLPTEINVFAIEYKLDFQAISLKELAAFYAKAIIAHTRAKPTFLMGHSMGGIICREMVEEMRLWNKEIPFVVMFDTWTIQSELLNIDKVQTFANRVFSCLPDRARRVESTIRLAKMLKAHKMSRSPTEIHLFKSIEAGDAAFHEVFRPNLTAMMSRSITANGLDRYCENTVHTYLINGNHESCLQIENLTPRRTTLLSLFKDWL